MEILVFIIDDLKDKEICALFMEHCIIPNVNDTISLTKDGDFVVARRKFIYDLGGECCSRKLEYVELRVYTKPKDKED